jgi:predicted nucleic acid-binding protein
MVVFDTSILLLLIEPTAKPPLNPSTGKPVENAPARITHLVSVLSEAREKIIVPTPVLSELLIHAGAAMEQYLHTLNGQASFRIANFDQKAAIEAAIAMSDAIRRGGIRVDATDPQATRGKVKFDRQIVAIAKAEGATAVYSDDGDVVKYAQQAGLKAYRTADLDLPPEDPQTHMDFGE